MARELVAGDYGDACRQYLIGCCRPIYWWPIDDQGHTILANGTITFIRTPTKLLGVTAAHVISDYLTASYRQPISLQIGDARFDDLEDRLIDLSEANDLATLEFDVATLDQIGLVPNPLTLWPPIPPEEGRGIMIGGFVGSERRIVSPMEVSFGLFSGLGIANTVNDDQITWNIDRDHLVESRSVPTAPQNIELGGISGGPLLVALERLGVNLVTFRLGGIVSQAHAGFEYVIAKRADMIREDGTIERRRPEPNGRD